MILNMNGIDVPPAFFVRAAVWKRNIERSGEESWFYESLWIINKNDSSSIAFESILLYQWRHVKKNLFVQESCAVLSQ